MIPAPLVQVWDATGATPLGVLAGWLTLAISDVFGDLGSLQLEVPRSVTGASLLDVDEDRQIRVSWPGTAAPAMWFVNDDDSSTWVSDAPESEPLKVTCRSLVQILDEAYVAPPGGISTTPTDWAFTGRTPGYIVVTLVAAAQARGLLQGLTVAGDAVHDATGVAWPATVPALAYKTGTSILSTMKGLYAAGMLEWRVTDRVLELHRPAGGLDRTLDVVLRPRWDVLSAPLQRSRRSLATAVIVEGGSSETTRRTQTLAGRRAREQYLSETSMTGTALDTVGDLFLAAHAVADVQMTHDLTDGDATPVPWVDYRPGDRLQTVAAGAGVTSRRVVQVALSMSPTDLKVTLELGSLLKTAEEVMQQQITRLAPGAAALT